MFDIELGHYLTYHHVTQNFFRKQRAKFDGLVVPLSVATVFKQGTGGFVLTLKKQYAIDPRTPIFQAAFDRDQIRPSHLEMAAVHGPSVEEIFISRPLEPTDLTTPIITDMAKRVATFQKEYSAQSAEKVDKYAKILGEGVEENYSNPQFLIPPYFRSTRYSDPWYQISLSLARAVASEKEGYSIAAVIHLTPDFPEAEFELLSSDYADDEFDGLIIFVNDLREYTASQSVLTQYARLVGALGQTQKPLLGLFGGYFTLMLRKIGLGCFSNGIGYGEYRNSGYRAGGQAVRRYYMPKLHRYFTDIEAQSITDIVNEPWILCGCSICEGGRRITDLSSQELLDHFLNIRFAELENARDNDLKSILGELNETSDMLSRHPIPGSRFEHLSRWATALQPFS